MLLQNPEHKKNDNAPIIEVDDDSPVSTGNDEVIVIDQEVAKPSFLSSKTSQNSQDSEVTFTLSSPSQKLVDNFELSESEPTKTYQEKDIQTENGIFISKEEFEQLWQKAETYSDFKNGLHKLCTYFSSKLNQCPEMDPSAFEKICKQVGAGKTIESFV